MGYVHSYTETEVSKILKDSEGSATATGGATGHAEGLHELQSVGRGRANTSEADLRDRAVEERKDTVGAFDGSQVAAITWALNTRAGQNTLMYLNGPKVAYVFAEIDVSSQLFKMKSAVANVPKAFDPVKNKTVKASGPMQAPVIQAQTTAVVCMKLVPMRGQLHIRTAFPMATPSTKGEHAECYYVADGGMPQQDIPI